MIILTMIILMIDVDLCLQRTWLIKPFFESKGSSELPGWTGLKSIRLTWASGKNLEFKLWCSCCSEDCDDHQHLILASTKVTTKDSVHDLRYLSPPPFSSWYDGMFVHRRSLSFLLVCVHHLIEHRTFSLFLYIFKQI